MWAEEHVEDFKLIRLQTHILGSDRTVERVECRRDTVRRDHPRPLLVGGCPSLPHVSSDSPERVGRGLGSVLEYGE